MIAKSNIILDVKPWDDETDMSVLEAEVRKITMDGLLWGACKLRLLVYEVMKRSLLLWKTYSPVIAVKARR